jgi:hypothetical protein
MPGPVAADGGTPHGAAADWGGFATASGLGGVGRAREVR